MGTGKLWISTLVFAGAVWNIERWGIRNSFPLYLKYIFVPGMLVFQIIFFMTGKKKWKKKLAAACVSALFLLAGCGGVEPEKRMYPLAL